MKKMLSLAAPTLLMGLALAVSPLAAAPSHAATAVKVEREKANKTVVKRAPARPTVVRRAAPKRVVVRHPQTRRVVVRHPQTRRVVVRHPHPRRAGHFWHRGVWHVRIHAPLYRWPHGWRYRVWAIGAILPPIFFASEYYYDDYGLLGLQAPPPGYRWVRYGDDLLLVNLRTGEVEDVVYDVFD
ncbi:MAG TPA: RcnB family protein [Rhizomicrobium sp.]|nr:RcnB family protein [Rhizomicrobium sp.]